MGFVAGGCDSNLLGNGEMIVVWVLPINEPDVYGVLAGAWLHLNGITQHFIHCPIAVVNTLAGIASCLLKEVKCAGDQPLVIALLLSEKLLQILLFNVPVPLAVRPIAEIIVPELLAEQSNHPLLGLLLDLPDRAHTNRILPVSNSCIMPCFRARVLARRCSNATSSASMSDSTSAIAVCSGNEGS